VLVFLAVLGAWLLFPQPRVIGSPALRPDASCRSSTPPSRSTAPAWLVIVARSWQTGLSDLSASTSISAVTVSPR